MPCAHPGCHALTTSGYCERHANDPKQRRRDADRFRGSRHERGYGGDWERLRSAYLSDHPLCADCELAGRTTAAVLVHHVMPIETATHLRLDWDNLRSLCHPCHERRHGRLRDVPT